jgi:hypothetical protein
MTAKGSQNAELHLIAKLLQLGAGAQRTHRAKNLKDLIQKGYGADSFSTSAKVRATLLERVYLV